MEFSDKSSGCRVENRLQRVQDLRQGVHQDAAERIQAGKEGARTMAVKVGSTVGRFRATKEAALVDLA